MIIEYDYKKCIVCLDRPPGDPEHIIPQMLGGRLAAYMLCDQCNHRFGSQLVSSLKTDISIRLAVEGVKDVVPDFASQFLERSEYIGTDIDHSSPRYSMKRGSLKLIPWKLPDGSITLDTDEALSALSKKLNRGGFDTETITKYISIFTEAGEDEPIKIPTGETFIKRLVGKVKPVYQSISVNNDFWLLVSLEFIALVIGNEIFRHSFDPVRDRLLGKSDTSPCKIDYLRAGNEYSPVHMIRLMPNNKNLSVEVRLFRWIARIIHFDWIEYTGPHPIYIEDLEKKKSFISPDADYADRNQWFETK